MTDLSAFVPRLAAELGAIDGSHWTSVEGSMLSADISGFTALSERLAGKGKAGAEEITELINTCFTALIDSAYDYGGEIIKFGGDALLVLFRGDEHMRRVANASLAMQVALHSSTAAKRAHLTMTVGAAEGPFDVFLVGSDYKELLITGSNATEVIHLEGEAAKGETLVSTAIAAVLPPEMVGRSHAGGLAIDGETGDPKTGPAERAAPDLDMTAFVPPQVLEQLRAFEEAGGEHRLVSVGFVMVGGVERHIDRYGPQTTAVELGRLLDDMMAATAPFGVTVLHTDIAPDGMKFVLCAGAPVNPGDTGDALLEAALQIAAIDSPFVIRQGVQTGRVFAGFLGSPYRRTYTLMGDTVNTAARMLGKADDRDIVAVATVVDDTRTVFVTEELEPFLVKGKTEPIVAHKVHASSDEVRRDGPMSRIVGRQAEIEALTRAIGELGEVVMLSGLAGVGKTRLLDASFDDAEGLRIFRASCTPYGAASPYSLFRPLLRPGSGIALDADADSAGRLLSDSVTERAPELLPMLPLLAVPFGASVEPTPEADAIDQEFRRARIHEVVVDFLDRVLDGPAFLVIEDLHWVDAASGELVNHLVRAAQHRPWAAVLTRRPEGDWELNDDLDHVIVLEVAPLGDADIRELAIETSARPLSDAEVDIVVGRSDGNPLFAIELARAVSTGGDGELPSTIEGLISTRVDNLPPDERRLLRIASVFGRAFDITDVASVAGEAVKVGRSLVDLVEHDEASRYRFRHAMYRDAAYEGLPFRVRRDLHGRVGRRLERRAPSPDSIADLLSLHFAEAGEHEKTWRYSLLAGEQATTQYAHAEGAVAYNRALSAARRLRSIDRGEVSEVAEHLGDALLASGDFDGAFAAFGRARRDADDLSTIRLMRRQGMVRDRQGSASVAARWYRRCLDRLPATGGSAEVRVERIHVALEFAAAEHRRGHFEECSAWAHQAANEARSLGQKSSLAKALDRLHVAATYLGLDEAETYGPEALALHRELGDHLSQARILDNMGIQAYFAQDWDRALELYAEASEAGRVAGDVIEANLGRNNAAEVLSDRGEFDLAEREFEDVLRNWTAAGWAFGMAGSQSNLALTRARRGDVDVDVTYRVLEACLEQFRTMGADEFIAEGLVRLCEAATHLGWPEATIEHAAGARLIVSDAAALCRIDRAEAISCLMTEDHSPAVARLHEALQRSTEAKAVYETALTTAVLATLDESPTGAAEHLLKELGVTRLPAAFNHLPLGRLDHLRSAKPGV